MKIFNKKLEAQYNEALKRKAEQSTATTSKANTTVTTTKATTAPTATAPKTTSWQPPATPTMSRADFNALSHQHRNLFIKAGGKLTN